MSTNPEIVARIVKNAEAAGEVRARAMFGGHGLFCDGKMVAIIDDDQLFVRITDGGREFLPDADEVPPYPGAKPYFLVSEAKWSKAEWLAEFLSETARQMPTPKPKKPRTEKRQV